MSHRRNKGNSFDVSIELSRTLKQHAECSGGGELSSSVVAFDENGKAISDSQVSIKGMGFLTD